MILEIDAGNTFVKWRRLADSVVVDRGRFLTQQFDADIPVAWDTPFSAIRVASVAGETVNQKIAALFSESQSVDALFAQTQEQCAGVKNSYLQPTRMGVDRWLAMLAAYNRARQACCVVDCGSAITIDYIDSSGAHEGGYIVPGLRLMKQGLLSNTAEIEVDQSISDFNVLPGTHTSAAVAHGINYLFLALAERVAKELDGSRQGYQLLVTGGDGALFASLVDRATYLPDLVLDGLVWSVGP